MNTSFKGPLFVVGVSRSGTKLLSRLLNNHPKVFVTHEIVFIPYFMETWGNKALSDKDIFRQMYNDIETTSLVWRKKSKPLIPEKTWYELSEKYNFSPQGVVESFVRYYVNNYQSDIIWGDKSNYLKKIGLLKSWFPGARFIHIVRDVRDASLSSHKAWKKSKVRYAQRWLDEISCAIDAFSQLNKDDYYEIRYEDLISNPKEIMTQCYYFLGLEFKKDYLKLTSPTEKVGDAKNALNIKKDNSEKYRQVYSENEIDRIEQIASSVLKRYGYHVNYQGPPKRISRIYGTYLFIIDSFKQLLMDYKMFGPKNAGKTADLFFSRIKIFIRNFR